MMRGLVSCTYARVDERSDRSGTVVVTGKRGYVIGAPPKPPGERRYPPPVHRRLALLIAGTLAAVAASACGGSGGTADKWAVGPQTDQPLTPVFINDKGPYLFAIDPDSHPAERIPTRTSPSAKQD